MVKYIEPGAYLAGIDGNIVPQACGLVFEVTLIGDDFRVDLDKMTITRLKTGEVHKITSITEGHIHFEPFKFAECSITMEGG